jgi:hypothetical protein
VLEVSSSGAILNLAPRGLDAGIIFISFSVIVIDQNSSHLELVTFVSNGSFLPVNISLQANSSKFDFSSVNTAPYSSYAFQWISGASSSASEPNYWSYLSL